MSGTSGQGGGAAGDAGAGGGGGTDAGQSGAGGEGGAAGETGQGGAGQGGSISQGSLESFGPALTYVYAGNDFPLTIPQVLVVKLSAPFVTDTFVQVISSDTTALTIINGGVTVPSGQTSAPVLLNGLAPAASVTLTATLDLVSLAATVRVLDASEQPKLVSLTPASAKVTAGGKVSLGVSLDIPAPAGGVSLAIAVDPPGAGSAPATVLVPAGQIEAVFDYTDAGAATSATVSVSLGAVTLSSMLSK